MIVPVTVDQIRQRFPLDEPTALFVWILLQASRDALVPPLEAQEGISSEAIRTAVTALLDRGYMCWHTRQGWRFGATPYSDSGRVLRGQHYLTRDGARAVLPYAISLLATGKVMPVDLALARRTLERAYLVTLTPPWPEVAAKHPMDVLEAPRPSGQAPYAGSHENIAFRPASVTWDGTRSSTLGWRWLMREVTLEGDALPSMVVDVQFRDRPAVVTTDVLAIDVAAEIALCADGSWLALGRYDPEWMTIACMRRHMEQTGRFPKHRDLSVGGAIGRPVQEEHLALSLSSNDDAFGRLLRDARFSSGRTPSNNSFWSADLRDLRRWPSRGPSS